MDLLRHTKDVECSINTSLKPPTVGGFLLNQLCYTISIMGGKIIKTVRFTTVIIGFIFLSFLFINSSVYGNGGGKHEVTHGNDAGALKKW